MAEIDPRIRQFEQEAAKTLAAMKRSRERAIQFEQETKRGRASRSELDQRVRQEVAKDRIRGETIGGERRPTSRTLEEESRATRNAAREQDRMTRASDKARASEARLTRQRVQSTRTLLSQQEAIRRYGQFAGQRFYERQAQQYYASKPLASDMLAGAAGGGRGGGALPPAPPGGPTGPGGKGPTGGPPRFNLALAEEKRNLAALESQLASSTRSHQRLIQVQSSGSNVLRRHGALTTEFIQAAARGEVTIRELGFQTAATIGKFGGWITAGAAIYGALGAVQQMSRGAIDAYSGVNQLQRVIRNVDSSTARREFSSLADEFQLPIGEVTQGVYEIGKVFHDQNTALEASKALLYSVKVGELDTATAGRYLIAITNAYNLSAQDLNATFDKFNQLQNQYGVAIAGTEAATSRAAGSFVNAGGSLDYLIALIGTASRVTGAAPERVGTAIQRAPSFVAKPQNESILRSFGIDPDLSIEQIIDQAFQIAQRSSGKRRRELAAAIFGPQYGAGIGTPLLRQFDLFKRIQQSIDKSEGSGARELARVKESPEEQLANIGVQLQRLGANLADSGLISLLAGTVLALDDILRLTNTIVETFNDLPGPLKDSLGILIQLGVAARLLGRLNVGGSLAPPDRQVGPLRTFAGAALSGGDRRDARLIRKGLFDERGVLEEERTRIADQAREQSSRAALADERAVKEQKRLVSLQANAAGNEKAIADSKAAVNTYVQEGNASRDAALRLSLDEEAKARRLNEVNQSINRTRGRFGGLNVPGTLGAADQRKGAYYPTSFDVPTTKRPTQYPPAAPGAGRYGAAIPAPGIPTTPIDLGRLEQETARADRTAKRQTLRLRRLRPAAARLGNSFNRLIGGMGNLIFAAFTIGFVTELLTSQVDEVNSEFERINVSSTNAKDAAARYKELGEKHSRTTADAINDALVYAGGLTAGVGNLLTGDFGGAFQDVKSGFEADTAGLINQEREFARQAQQARKYQQEKARREGRPIPNRYVADIQRNISELKLGDLSSERAAQTLARYRAELAASMESVGAAAGTRKEQQARLKAAIAQLNQKRAETAGPRGLAATLAALDPRELQQQLESEVTQASVFGGTTRDRIRRASTIYSALQRRLSKSRDPESVQALADARNSYFDGLEQAVQDELDHALGLATSSGDRNKAYAQAFQSLRSAYVDQNQGAIRAQQQRVENLRRQLREGSLTTPLAEAPGLFGKAADFLGIGDWEYPRTSPEGMKKLREQLRAATGSLRNLREDDRQRREYFRQIKDELRKQQYEENAAIREAQTQLKVSRTADPLKQAKVKLSALNLEIGKAIEIYGRSSKEVLELLQQRQEVLAQQAQDQVNLIDARGALRAASLSGEGDEVRQARAELGTLQTKLAYMRSHSNRFDPAEIVQLQADVRSAQIDLAEQIEQEAEDLALAAIDIRIARAEAGGNDVRAARLNVTKAQYELRHADTPLERRQSRADLIGKRASLRDAASQKAIEDIEFQADIGKLTLDQQISAYQRVLNTMKLTRDARRDLRRRIYQLRQESEQDATFDLNVGSIKLPTIYEIRRAVKGGVNGGGVNVNQRNTYHIRSSDPHGVALEINKLNGGANKAALRSAGVR